MKKFIALVLVLVLVLSCGVLFASCGNDDNNGSVVETYKDSKEETQTTTEESTRYTVMGGSDPYVEDIF